MLGARLLNELAENGAQVGGIEDKALFGEIGHCDLVAARQPVVAWQHGDQRLRADHFHRELGRSYRWSQEAEVERPVEQARHLRRRDHLPVERELHAGQALAQLGRDRGQQRVGGRPGEPDRQAPDLAVRGAAAVLGGELGRREDRLRPLQQELSGRSELDPTGGAVEERDAELRFQAPDLLRSGGCAMCSRSAARPKWSSSATARK